MGVVTFGWMCWEDDTACTHAIDDHANIDLDKKWKLVEIGCRRPWFQMTCFHYKKTFSKNKTVWGRVAMFFIQTLEQNIQEDILLGNLAALSQAGLAKNIVLQPVLLHVPQKVRNNLARKNKTLIETTSLDEAKLTYTMQKMRTQTTSTVGIT